MGSIDTRQAWYSLHRAGRLEETIEENVSAFLDRMFEDPRFEQAFELPRDEIIEVAMEGVCEGILKSQDTPRRFHDDVRACFRRQLTERVDARLAN